MFTHLPWLLSLLLLTTGTTFAQTSISDTSSAMYMANEGLMVVQGETKVLFDPLFRSS